MRDWRDEGLPRGLGGAVEPRADPLAQTHFGRSEDGRRQAGLHCATLAPCRMAQKPWPVQMGSFALLPEHRYSLQMASLAAHHHPVAHGHAAYHPALHAQHPALLHAAYGYHHNGPARVVGAHPHEGWRGAQHVMRRAAQLPQPHVGHGGPHALLNEISGQALHRYRAHHWVDKVDPSEIDARCAATLASAQRLATAVLALCESGGGNVAPVMADIAGSLALLQAQLPTDDTGGGELEAIAALRAQLDALEKQVADRQTESGEADTPDAAEP
jgi:hypothetical protein